jgi:hypothetical protein
MSFSPTTTTQPGKFFAALSDFVTKRVDLHDQRAPVALCDFVFGNNVTVVHEFCRHALWIDYFDVVTHLNATQIIATTSTTSMQTII